MCSTNTQELALQAVVRVRGPHHARNGSERGGRALPAHAPVDGYLGCSEKKTVQNDRNYAPKELTHAPVLRVFGVFRDQKQYKMTAIMHPKNVLMRLLTRIWGFQRPKTVQNDRNYAPKERTHAPVLRVFGVFKKKVKTKQMATVPRPVF
jgi:hypothetical protein